MVNVKTILRLLFTALHNENIASAKHLKLSIAGIEKYLKLAVN